MWKVVILLQSPIHGYGDVAIIVIVGGSGESVNILQGTLS